MQQTNTRLPTSDQIPECSDRHLGLRNSFEKMLLKIPFPSARYVKYKKMYYTSSKVLETPNIFQINSVQLLSRIASTLTNYSDKLKVNCLKLAQMANTCENTTKKQLYQAK